MNLLKKIQTVLKLKAIRKANELKKLTGYKHAVFKRGFGFKVYKVADLKEFIKKGLFRKRTNIRNLLERAVYVTV